MKPFLLVLATLALFPLTSAQAQTPVAAPTGWKTQTKAGGARTFTPPDLRAGEIYNVTLYDPAQLNGKSLEAYLREFAGPVGTKAGQLAAALQMGTNQARVATATGVYNGPNGTRLIAFFAALAPDGGARVAVSRTLSSPQDGLIKRYETTNLALTEAMFERAQAKGNRATKTNASKAEREAADAREAAQKARREEAKAAAPRRRFSTVPGKGISIAQIALVLHDSRLISNGMSTFISAEQYLLLRDGTVHRGLAVPPDELNLAISRRGEPENWGKWRRKGADFEVSWQGKTWESLRGERVQPGAPQTRLAARFGAGSGSSGAGMSSYGFWGVTFDKIGRFRKDSRNGTSSGASAGAQSAGVPAINTTSDDSSSSTTIGLPGATVLSKTRRNPNGNNEGTYTINGYTLTLRYDNGRVARLPFFFYGAKQQGVWFEDSLLFRDDK